jgi:hypothetical protein
MANAPHSPLEELVDEISAESFPASDAPSWTATHAGQPAAVVRLPGGPEHGPELRATLRADLERLMRAPRPSADPVVWAALEAGRSVVREAPPGGQGVAFNLEAEQRGAERDAPCVVVAARYDVEDASCATMLLAVLRSLASSRTRRPLRFAALAAEGGGARYAEHLRTQGTRVHAVLSLARLDLSRERGHRAVFFAGNLRSLALARTARNAFRHSSRIRAHALALPGWMPGFSASDHAAFWRLGWRGLMVADRVPWRIAARAAQVPDIDCMAAAVPGVAAAVLRLAGGHA